MGTSLVNNIARVGYSANFCDIASQRRNRSESVSTPIPGVSGENLQPAIDVNHKSVSVVWVDALVCAVYHFPPPIAALTFDQYARVADFFSPFGPEFQRLANTSSDCPLL